MGFSVAEAVFRQGAGGIELAIGGSSLCVRIFHDHTFSHQREKIMKIVGNLRELGQQSDN